MNNTAIYPRLAPFIREYIYRERWDTLHSIQEKAAAAIFDTKDHVLIAAGTAGGKTEAAFFPILSILDTVYRRGEKALVLYISPLKALINDQAKRLEYLLTAGQDSAETIIPVWRWHGDVDSSKKNRFAENPSGILLITPESLESLLLHRSRELGRIFNGLLFAVIDEIHVFMGSDRGSQLICQIERIGQAKRDFVNQQNINDTSAFYNAVSCRRIGLSATLGDYKAGCNWLSRGTDLHTTLVNDDRGAGKELSLALDYTAIKSAHKKSTAFYQSLYNQCSNKRAIIFTNSRLEAEECSASLGSLAKANGAPDIFQIHHGSVSAMFRDEAEEFLKFGEGPQVICATATLELGIDIGDLDRIIQLGPPWSVSAFVQRVGRSGRRNGKAEMYFSIFGTAVKETALNSTAKKLAAMPWELLRAIAVIQLYLEEKWIEPPVEKTLPFSLLIHQSLAILASLGEHSADRLIRQILSFPPFAGISIEDYRILIAWLTDCGIIGTTEEGTLILGIEGERIVNRHSFYQIFPGDETYRVVLDGREIGSINYMPDPMSVLIVGGQRWTVKSIDRQKREIWVTETEDEGNERLWRGRGGGTHNRVIEKMKQILAEEDSSAMASYSLPAREKYPYLSINACKTLKKGCSIARFSGITEYPLIFDDCENNSGKGKTTTTAYVFPWTGSAGMRTIATALGNDQYKKSLRIVSIKDSEIYFTINTKLTQDKFCPALIEVLHKAIGSFDSSTGQTDLLQGKDLPCTDKYDYLLPPKLLAKQYAANMLDKTALEKLLSRLL